MPAASPAPARLSPSVRWLLVAVAAGVVAVALLAAAQVHRQQQALAQERVQAAAELRQARLTGWLQNRLGLARFLSSSPLWAELYMRPAEPGQPDGAQRLLARAEAFVQANGGVNVRVFDARAVAVAAGAGAPPPTDSLHVAVREAMASGELRLVPAFTTATAPLRVDVVMPLLATLISASSFWRMPSASAWASRNCGWLRPRREPSSESLASERASSALRF